MSFQKPGFCEKRMVEWKVSDRWGDENNRLLEGRTVLIFKGGDRKDQANYRPITCLPTITKMITLAIHKQMRQWLFERVGKTSRGVIREESDSPRGAGRLSLRTLLPT